MIRNKSRSHVVVLVIFQFNFIPEESFGLSGLEYNSSSHFPLMIINGIDLTA